MTRIIKVLSSVFGLILLISFMHGENQERIIVQEQIRYKIIIDPPFQSVGKISVHYPEELKVYLMSILEHWVQVGAYTYVQMNT